jgi:hypothetical protein
MTGPEFSNILVPIMLIERMIARYGLTACVPFASPGEMPCGSGVDHGLSSPRGSAATLELITGCFGPASGAIGLLVPGVRPASAGFRKILFRGDTDFSQTAYLDGWARAGIGFVFGMDSHATLQALAQAIPERTVTTNDACFGDNEPCQEPLVSPSWPSFSLRWPRSSWPSLW